MLQAKFEQQEKMRSSIEMTVKFAINDMRSDTAKLLDIIKAKDDEIANLHIIVRNYKEQVQSLEMQLLGIHVLEVKLRNLNNKHQKEAGEMKKYYETELANLTKETSQIHKALSSNLAHDEKFKLIQKEVETYTQVNIQKMQTLEAKIKYLQELAERASPSPVHGARRNSKIEGLKQSAMSGTGMVSPQKDMSLNNREGNVLRESVKADSVVLKSYNTFADYVNDNEVKQNDVKDEVFIASSEKKMGYNNISGIRRTKETQEASKAVFEKQRKRLLQEINILSIKRTGDLSNQTKEAYNNFAFNDSHFNNYYEQMVAKLDSLTQLNDKEKMELHKLDPRGFSARHRHSKSVGGRSAVRLNLGANFPKPSGEQALSMSQSPDKITSHKKKLERSSSLIKAIKQAKKIVFKSTNRPTTAN